MADSSKPKKCECGQPMQRDMKAEQRGRRNVCDTYPFHSTAAGVAPSQVPEMMEFDRQHGVATTYNRDGEPEFRSPGHRRAYCKAHGLVDRNAGYSDPQ